MSKTSARLTHVTVNGLGEAPASRPAPDHLTAARLRREVIANSVRFFTEEGDHAAADAARAALAEQDALIANLEAANVLPELDFPRLQAEVDAIQAEQTIGSQADWIIHRVTSNMSICPVCGRNLTEVVPFDTVCPACQARWFEQISEIQF